MRGVAMTTNTMTAYDGLSVEYKSLVDDFINMLTIRQRNDDETLRVIRDSRNGIGLSKAYNSVDDLMEDINADD